MRPHLFRIGWHCLARLALQTRGVADTGRQAASELLCVFPLLFWFKLRGLLPLPRYPSAASRVLFVARCPRGAGVPASVMGGTFRGWGQLAAPGGVGVHVQRLIWRRRSYASRRLYSGVGVSTHAWTSPRVAFLA